MRFFSKIVFICNLCFIAAVILRWVENAKKKSGYFEGALILKPLQSTLVVLGYGAIFVNFIFNLFVFWAWIQKKELTVSRWLIYTNFLFLLLQVYYFFFTD